MFESGRVLDAKNYATATQPYPLEKVAAAALEELRRKRDAERTRDSEHVDPVALRQREEAAALRAQAARLLTQAQAKADALVAEAEARSLRDAAKARESAVQEGLAQGKAAGHAEGLSQGKAEGLGQYSELLTRFQGLLKAALEEKEAFFKDREDLLVELAVQVAAKVIHREVETRPDHIQNLLRQAIPAITDKARLLVIVNPEDLASLKQAEADGLLNFSGVKQLEFLADDKMVAGGLRIASGYRTWDAALDSQLAEICRGLLEEAHHEA